MRMVLFWIGKVSDWVVGIIYKKSPRIISGSFSNFDVCWGSTR
jgi:hypothetical protein